MGPSPIRRLSTTWLPLLLLPIGVAADQRAAVNCTLDSRTEIPTVRQRWSQISNSSDAVSRGRGVRRGVNNLIPHKNFIDDELFATMTHDNVKPTSLAGDEEFLRRAFLSLTGRIPDANTVRAFVADSSADKRGRVINDLLTTEGFADRWTMWFGDLVQNVQFSTFTAQRPQGRNAFHKWIKDSFLAGKPYDQMVREVLAGKGDNFVDGPPNYVVRQLQPNGPIQDTYDNLSAHSGERFLALPMNCLSCHDGLRHLESVNAYLSSRKRAEFWANAAFFARTNARAVPDPTDSNIRHIEISDGPGGEYRLNTVSGNKTPRQPAASQQNVVPPAFFLTGETPNAGENRREAYGRFLTKDPQFARATVNHIWREMFGLALVEPIDSIDLFRIFPDRLPPGATLQTLHPSLLQRLTDFFIASGYDFRALVRLMADSSAWQLSTVYDAGSWNETWTPYYARHYARRISSEAMLDAIFTATSVDGIMQVNLSPSVRRAMQLPDPLEPLRSPFNNFLNVFGRGDRDDTPRTDDSSIAQSLMMMNDNIITSRVRQNTQGSTVQRILAATREPEKIAEELYLATLSRRPTVIESARAVDHLTSGDLVRNTEDLQYALINSLEFMFN